MPAAVLQWSYLRLVDVTSTLDICLEKSLQNCKCAACIAGLHVLQPPLADPLCMHLHTERGKYIGHG